MNSSVKWIHGWQTSDQILDLDNGLPVTLEDVAALRRLKSTVPSWLFVNAAEIQALVPPGGLRERPVANDSWRPFSLD